MTVLLRPYRDTEDARPFGVVAEEHGEIVGRGWMDSWDEADGTRLHLLSGCVDPRWRRRGVGTAILRWLEERVDRTPGSTFGVNVAPHETGKLAMITAHGYRLAFTVVELARDLNNLEPHPLPPGLVLRPVEPAHHPLIYAAIDECFADSGHGHQTQTYDEYLRDVQDVELWTVAWAGDSVAAVVVNERQPDGTASTPWVAVRPPWRRRGVGLALMSQTLRTLADSGVTRARLRTVQENPHNSVGLYERAGYAIVDRQPRYRKALDSPTYPEDMPHP
ncbi:GNAT family N-acetyltransferase [Asanoa ishikariensis]|uniref:GNAT family N-acetyltransferase n=1 Tax=Asanoa ishikariensis TaxID=137265 RepID=UPI0015A0B97F|nr:GNAT family N-acetyltransferase [Asanoa ishikariensis]